MRFRIILHFISFLLITQNITELNAQVQITKEVDISEVFFGDSSPVTFTIEIFNPSSCDAPFILTDDLQTPSIIVNQITTTDNNHIFTASQMMIEWSGILPPNTSYFMTIEVNLSNYDFYLFGGVFSNTANIDYSYDCCTAILNDNDPDNDALCPSSPSSNCGELLADSDPSNDGDCTGLCDIITNDNIPENDYLCQSGIGGGNSYSASSSTTVSLGVNNCICDPSFTFSVDPQNILTANANNSYFFDEWSINNQVVGTDNPNLVLPLTAGDYEICHKTMDDCGIDECTQCETFTINECSTIPLSATAVITDLDCASGTSTSIDITVTGGLPDYSFLWTGGSTTEDLDFIINPGTYTVTITDECDDILIESFFIEIDTIFEPCDPSFTHSIVNLSNGTSDISLNPTDNFYVGGYFTINNTPLATGVSFINLPTVEFDICYITSDECISLFCQECINIPPPCKYALGNELVSCDDNNTFCMPLIAVETVTEGIIGMDYCLTFDHNLVTPTGNAFLGEVVLDGDINADYELNISSFDDMICISIYYNSSAAVGANFIGAGEVACIEFEGLNDFYEYDPLDMLPIVDFEAMYLIESYTLDIVFECADPGTAVADESDSTMKGRIIYWDDDSRPLRYDETDSSNFNETEIRAMDVICQQPIDNTPIFTDIEGNFEFNVNQSQTINIFRDIDSSSDMMEIINGMDLFNTNQVVTFNTDLIPNHYQMIAMDVNMNNSITAGDVTLMENRITSGGSEEYPQVWNQNLPDIPSMDWLFVDETTIMNDPTFTISQNYPFEDNIANGFHRFNVPNTAFCYDINVIDDGFCLEAEDMLYHAILLGDTDGSWNLANEALFRAGNETMNLDLSNAIVDDCQILLPISVSEMENIKALDFILEYNQQKMIFESIEYGSVGNSQMGMAFNQIENGNIIFTSYSKTYDGIDNIEQVFYYAKFNIISDDMTINPSDLVFKKSFLDGITSLKNIDGNIQTCSSITGISNIGEGESVSVYPNPFDGTFVIETKGFDGNIPFEIQLYDVTGKIISSRTFTTDNYTFIQKDLPQGVYIYELKRADVFIHTGRLIAK